MIELELHSDCFECGFPAINPLAHAGDSVPCVNCNCPCGVPFPGQEHLRFRCDDCGHSNPLDHDEECESCGGTSLNNYCEEHKNTVENRVCLKCAQEASSEDGPAHKHGNELFLDVLCCVMVADGQATKVEKSRVCDVMQEIQPAWKRAAIGELIVRYIKRIKREGYKPVLTQTFAEVEFLDVGKLENLSKCIKLIADADDTIDDRERKVCNMIMKSMPLEMKLEIHSECSECAFPAINPLARAGDSVPCVNCCSPCDVPHPGQSHQTLRCDECGHPHLLDHDEECDSCGGTSLNPYCQAHGAPIELYACLKCAQEASTGRGDNGIIYTHHYQLLLDVLCCVMQADGHASKIEKTKVRAVMGKMQTAWSPAAVDELIVRYIKRVKREGYSSVLKATLVGVGFLDASKRPIMDKCIKLITGADDIINESERKVCDLVMKAIQPDFRSPWERFRDRWLKKNKRARD